MVGFLAKRPQPAAWCHHCWSNGDYDAEPPRRFKHPAGSFYCFICDEVTTDECAFGWLGWHAQHIKPEDDFYCEERVRLRSGCGIYAWIPGDHAERYRPAAYIDLLERYDWDEERVPRHIRKTPRAYGELHELVERFIDAAHECDPGPEIDDLLLRVIRSKEETAAWRSRIRRAFLVLDALRGATKLRTARTRKQWTSQKVAPLSNTVCSACGKEGAPYGPPPHYCVACLLKQGAAQTPAEAFLPPSLAPFAAPPKVPG